MENSQMVEELIKSIKENLVLNTEVLNGPSYHVMNKMLADLYFNTNNEMKAIYHLTESHAATLRQLTMAKYDYKEDMMKNQQEEKNSNVAHGIKKEYIEFDSEIALQQEEGLLNRLREMPKEWTVVQVTRQFDPETTLTASTRTKDYVQKPTCLHITQLPCGEVLDERLPVSVMVGPPEGVEGMPTLFDLMSQATKQYLRTREGGSRKVLKAREQASENIKEVVTELSSRYLKEWKCLLLGRLCSNSREEQVTNCVDSILAKHTSIKLEKRTRQLLHSVASGAVYLSLAEIESAVTCVVDCRDLATDLVKGIQHFKEDMSLLLVANRHPIILILDEEMDSLPWEMMDVLKKHPVSRVPSIHFLHALFHEHKDHIVAGCRLVDQPDLGFYIINPDQDLKETESRLVKFLKDRMPVWKGVQGTVPTEDQFSDALTTNNVFMYCGHFNGSHIFRSDDVSKLRVVALPLLFGCSSVALQQLGGRAHPSGVSDKYFMAGCACMVGMLWTVTSDDTDCMTVTLLNSWLPGKPMDLTNFRSSGDQVYHSKEPELLRLLRHARDTPRLYSNAAALVARGIPVKMID